MFTYRVSIFTSSSVCGHQSHHRNMNNSLQNSSKLCHGSHTLVCLDFLYDSFWAIWHAFIRTRPQGMQIFVPWRRDKCWKFDLLIRSPTQPYVQRDMYMTLTFRLIKLNKRLFNNSSSASRKQSWMLSAVGLQALIERREPVNRKTS